MEDTENFSKSKKRSGACLLHLLTQTCLYMVSSTITGLSFVGVYVILTYLHFRIFTFLFSLILLIFFLYNGHGYFSVQTSLRTNISKLQRANLLSKHTFLVGINENYLLFLDIGGIKFYILNMKYPSITSMKGRETKKNM